MKQIVQPIAGGAVEVLDVPRPAPDATEVLVRTVSSVISPGTERAVTALAQASLLAKARARPDLVRQVVRKARTEGLAATTQTVRSRLAEDLPLGYSAAGLVVEVGAAVTGVRTGQLVATGGAGKANHAEFQAVPGLLCAAVPDGVPAQDAAFTTVASIALHALRLADAGAGSKVVVLGLGLIGQLAARLAMAAGCDVAGIDPAGYPRQVAAGSGVLALDERGDATTDQVLSWSRGRGADAVLVCAAGRSSDAVMRVPALCRDRAAVVVVGDVGLQLRRAPFYERELSLRFARSYGPGRYEPSYEAWGVDYPAGQVRWTEGRNFEAVLDLLAAGRLQVSDLVTHTYDIAEAAAAYKLIEERADPYLAIRLAYPDGAVPDGPVRLRSCPPSTSSPGVGWVGAGAFSTGTLLPAFRAAGFDHLVAVASASGLSARRAAERHGFEKAVSGADAVIGDPDVRGRRGRHPARHARGPGGAGAARGTARVVRETARADQRRAGHGRERLAGVGAAARGRLQPALVAGCVWPPSGRSPGWPRRSWSCTESRPGGCRTVTGTTTGGRAAGCSARYAISWTPRRRSSAPRSRT